MAGGLKCSSRDLTLEFAGNRTGLRRWGWGGSAGGWRGLHKRARVCLPSDDCVLEGVGSSVTYAWVPPPHLPRSPPEPNHTCLSGRLKLAAVCLSLHVRAKHWLRVLALFAGAAGGKCVRLTVNDVTVGPALLRVLTPGAKLFQMFLLGSQSWHHLSLRPLAPPPRPCPSYSSSKPSPKPSSSPLSVIMHLAS